MIIVNILNFQTRHLNLVGKYKGQNFVNFMIKNGMHPFLNYRMVRILLLVVFRCFELRQPCHPVFYIEGNVFGD